MADWGNIGIGVAQGLNQGLRTVAEVQKMKLLNDQEDRAKNLYNVQMKRIQEDEQPVYIDRLSTPDNKNEYDLLRKRAETAGILYTDATGREYTKRGMGKDFLALQKPDIEIMQAKLKDATTSEQILKDQLANTTKPDEVSALKDRLSKVAQDRDMLSAQYTALAGKPVAVRPGGSLVSPTGTVVYQAPAAPADANKNQTPEQLAAGMVRETLKAKGENREPTATEINTQIQKNKLLTPEQLAQQVTIAKSKADAAGAGAKLEPGTLDYMVQKYETDGVIPPFGMGAVGAKQRASFFNKAAERAAQRGDTGAAQAIRQAEFKSSQATLTDLTKREQLIQSYNARIKDTTDNVLTPLVKKWDLQNPRFVNWPVNKLAEIMGSGDLAALKLALNSVSVEVGKVEFNALGIQQLTDSAAKFMNSVHDPSMKVGELLKVLQTSKDLGDTGMNAISNQRKDLIGRIKKIAPNAPITEQGSRPLPKF